VASFVQRPADLDTGGQHDSLFHEKMESILARISVLFIAGTLGDSDIPDLSAVERFVADREVQIINWIAWQG
jgi:hypothetical protein